MAMKNDPLMIAKLLRIMGGATRAIEEEHDAIFNAAAALLVAQHKALKVASDMVMKNEPGDSRAVSDTAVAICAVSTGDYSTEVLRVLDKHGN